MPQVRITKAIAYEYVTRDVFPSMDTEGTFYASPELCREMIEDAEFYSDKDGPEVHHSLKRSYSKHAARLRVALALRAA